MYQSRAKAAANGSSADLISFLKLFPEVPDPKRALLIPLLFAHLDPSRIPKPKQLDSILSDVARHPELDGIAGGLTALYEVSELLDVRLIQHPLYAELWPRLYPWLIFAHTYHDYIPVEYSMGLAQLHRASAFIILTIRTHGSMKAVVEKATGLRYILAGYWAKIVRKIISTDVEVAYILSFLSDCEEEGAANFQEVLDGIAGDPRDLAYLLVQQIKVTVASTVNDATNMAVGSILRVLNMHGSQSPLGEGMLLNGGVTAAMRAIAFQDRERRGGADWAGEQVYIGMLFLLGNVESGEGMEWISQALSSGLFKLIATMIRARQERSYELWYTFSLLERFLKVIFPEYLVHYKITVQMKTAISEAIPITSSPMFKTSFIYPFWVEFSDLVQERFRALDLFLNIDSRLLDACENMQCCKTGGKDALKRCAACGLALYCSRECQKADWVAAHRCSCQRLGSSGISSARGRGYLGAILQYNFQSCSIRRAVLTQQAQFMYRNPETEFVTVLDFTRNARGTHWIDMSGGWSEVKPISNYDALLGLKQIACRTRNGPVSVYLAALDFNKVVERMFPMWSTPQLHSKVAGIVQALPRGLKSAALDAALAQPLQALAANAAELMQEIYY
ncbi:hypothetical protein B0H16DRAFT_1455444 [Mycena metata]|uniref:MYND-type domain-containing protein n=1 Tax=Mycena metata TaxID=1033252 RepID=A0AAD7NI18_9AGAR|nr:hypothetical protein B0H16DRAFT_1455444 [Mycena metata]